MDASIAIFSIFSLSFKTSSMPVKVALCCLWAVWAVAQDRVLPVYHYSKTLLSKYKVQTHKKTSILMFLKKKQQWR